MVAKRPCSELAVITRFVLVGPRRPEAACLGPPHYRSVELRASRMDDAQLDSLAGAELRDFDWSCRLVLSSNRYSTMRVPVLMLKLTLEKPGGEIEDVVMELGREKLDAVLKRLSGASQVLRTPHT